LINLGLLFFGPLGGFLIELLLEAPDRGFGLWIGNRSRIFFGPSRRRVPSLLIAFRGEMGRLSKRGPMNSTGSSFLTFGPVGSSSGYADLSSSITLAVLCRPTMTLA
jgi:hypothetical protein